MPYIVPDQRTPYYKHGLNFIAGQLIEADNKGHLSGELNFLISYLVRCVMTSNGENYARYNAIIGALECCKLELYRRMVGPYEDRAIERNGDV